MINRIRLHAKAISLAFDDWRSNSLPYVGVPHNGNVGDEELFRIAQRAIVTPNLATEPKKRGRYVRLSVMGSSGHYMIGGGSLIFGPHLLKQCERLNQYGGSPILIGTGCTNFPEDPAMQQRWANVLRSSPLLGVRGQYSKACLQRLGVEAEIVGDFGYWLNLDLEKARTPADYVVINARSIASKLIPELGQRDAHIREQLIPVVEHLSKRNIPIVVISAYISADHKAVEEWVATLPCDVKLVLYQGDFTEMAELLQKARALVTMRMHPGIFAAAYGTPAIMLDNRAKYDDSLSPVPRAATLLDPDTLNSQLLIQHLEAALAESMAQRQARFDEVRQLALRQQAYSQRIRQLLIN